MNRILALSVMAAILLGGFQPVHAQASVTFDNVLAGHDFGSQITFKAHIAASGMIQEVLLYFQPEGDANIRIQSLQPDANGAVTFQYDIQQGILRPFVRIFFWFQVTLSSNEQVTSQKYYLDYTDNRTPWNVRESGNVRVHWYEGDAAFGEKALNAAYNGLQKFESLMPVSLTKPVDIYIYASSEDVQGVLNLGGMTWVAGHASPDLGVVLVSIMPGPEQGIEMDRQIPHELAHVLTYQVIGVGYFRLPAWLREGIASSVEIYPNADYETILTAASKADALIPIVNLCTSFPLDASGAFLAYAEADSFTRYLHRNYGTSGLQDLLEAYADGLDCENGATRAFGKSLTSLDFQWRQAVFGEAKRSLAFEKIVPYLMILFIILLVPAWQVNHSRRKF